MKCDGINPLERLHPGEPYFLIRAQDKFALSAIQAYASIANHHKSCHQVMTEFEEWQKSHPQLVKTPD